MPDDPETCESCGAEFDITEECALCIGYCTSCCICELPNLDLGYAE